ncbi:hypothetical protein ACOMHN_025468 [Nucella lapillus]
MRTGFFVLLFEVATLSTIGGITVKETVFEAAAQKNIHNSADASIMFALRIAFWLAKEDLPVNKYSSLMELQKLQGCDAMAQLSVAGNASYTSRASGKEFQE